MSLDISVISPIEYLEGRDEQDGMGSLVLGAFLHGQILHGSRDF